MSVLRFLAPMLLLASIVASALAAPPASRVEAVVDTLHGVTVPDPYRWLEDGGSAEVQAWTEAQNAHTAARLNALPIRAEFEERLLDIMAVGRVGVPVPRGERIFGHQFLDDLPVQLTQFTQHVIRKSAQRDLTLPAQFFQ